MLGFHECHCSVYPCVPSLADVYLLQHTKGVSRPISARPPSVSRSVSSEPRSSTSALPSTPATSSTTSKPVLTPRLLQLSSPTYHVRGVGSSEAARLRIRDAVSTCRGGPEEKARAIHSAVCVHMVCPSLALRGFLFLSQLDSLLASLVSSAGSGPPSSTAQAELLLRMYGILDAAMLEGTVPFLFSFIRECTHII